MTPSEFYNICYSGDYVDDEFLACVKDYFDTFTDDKDAVDCILKHGGEIRLYQKIKILLDYSCKCFNTKLSDIEQKISTLEKKSIPNEYLIFAINKYFLDEKVAISKLKNTVTYRDIYQHTDYISEEMHLKKLRDPSFLKSYFRSLVNEYRLNISEIEKCLKAKLRPCKKSWNRVLCSRNLSPGDCIKLFQLLKKYNIPLNKVERPIVDYALETANVKLLDVCIQYGLNIIPLPEQSLFIQRKQFIERLIDIGFDTFDIANVIIDWMQ